MELQKLIPRVMSLTEAMMSPIFYERLYFSLQQYGLECSYGDFIEKCKSNGIVKVLKSLNLWKTTGRGESKIVKIHPLVQLVIDTTLADGQIVAQTIIDLCNGKIKIERINFDYTAYNELLCIIKPEKYTGFNTYIIYSKQYNMFKIGKSKTIGLRLQALACEHGHELNLLAYVERDIESQLHYEYRDSRVHSEWFRFEFSEVENIIKSYNMQTVTDCKLLKIM